MVYLSKLLKSYVAKLLIYLSYILLYYRSCYIILIEVLKIVYSSYFKNNKKKIDN